MRLAPLLLALTLLSCGCDQATPGGSAPAPPALPAPPPAAVIRIGPGEYLAEPHYILAAEIDHWVPTVALLEPEESQRSWRRKALTNINLPVAVLAALYPEDRAAALREAEEMREALVSGRGLALDGPQVTRVEGHSFELRSLIVWGAAISLERNVWSEVIETGGGFAILRRVSAAPVNGWRGHTPVAIDLLQVRFVPLIEVEIAIEDARPKLGVVPVGPPEWDGILPAFYVYE